MRWKGWPNEGSSRKRRVAVADHAPARTTSATTIQGDSLPAECPHAFDPSNWQYYPTHRQLRCLVGRASVKGCGCHFPADAYSPAGLGKKSLCTPLEQVLAMAAWPFLMSRREMDMLCVSDSSSAGAKSHFAIRQAIVKNACEAIWFIFGKGETEPLKRSGDRNYRILLTVTLMCEMVVVNGKRLILSSGDAREDINRPASRYIVEGWVEKAQAAVHGTNHSRESQRGKLQRDLAFLCEDWLLVLFITILRRFLPHVDTVSAWWRLLRCVSDLKRWRDRNDPLVSASTVKARYRSYILQRDYSVQFGDEVVPIGDDSSAGKWASRHGAILVTSPKSPFEVFDIAELGETDFAAVNPTEGEGLTQVVLPYDAAEFVTASQFAYHRGPASEDAEDGVEDGRTGDAAAAAEVPGGLAGGVGRALPDYDAAITAALDAQLRQELLGV